MRALRKWFLVYKEYIRKLFKITYTFRKLLNITRSFCDNIIWILKNLYNKDRSLCVYFGLFVCMSLCCILRRPLSANLQDLAVKFPFVGSLITRSQLLNILVFYKHFLTFFDDFSRIIK